MGNNNEISLLVFENLLGGPQLEALCGRLGIVTKDRGPFQIWGEIGMVLASNTPEFKAPASRRGPGRPKTKGTSEDLDYQRARVINKLRKQQAVDQPTSNKKMTQAAAVRKAMDDGNPLFIGDDEMTLASSVSRGMTVFREAESKIRNMYPQGYAEMANSTKLDSEKVVVAEDEKTQGLAMKDVQGLLKDLT